MEMKKKGKRWKKVLLMICCILLLLVGTVVGTVYFLGRDFYNSSNYTSDEDAMKDFVAVDDWEDDLEEDTIDNSEEGNDASDADNEETGSNEDDNAQKEENPEDGLTKEEQKELKEEINQFQESEEVKKDRNVYNVLLIGVDQRDKSWAGNSDAMILVSLNYEKKQISMISLMRDSYVNIPGIGMRKLNAAHANGAGPLLLKTVTQNYKIQVDRYVTVNLSNLAELVDALGGIELTLTKAEADFMGEYDVVPGKNLCNGITVVRYARIRSIGNSDYQRTERQRAILTSILEKMKTMSVNQLYDFVNKVLPLVTHNIPEDEMWSLLPKAPTLLSYKLVKERVPYDGMYRPATINKRSVLVLDWEKNITRMKKTLY